jgi:hypothetical protein
MKVGVIVVCSLGLMVIFGCLSPTLQSERIDVVSNPELVKYCTLKSEGRYSAVGEKNALTLAKNATAERGGNVLLTVAINKIDTLTTEVHGKIYACEHKP